MSSGRAPVAGTVATSASAASSRAATLLPEQAHGLRLRSDPDHARGDDLLGEIGVLRQEAVDRVHRIGFGGDPQHLLNGKAGPHRSKALPDQIALVGLEPVQGQLVLGRMDRDCPDAEFVGSPHHADGDLAAVGGDEGVLWSRS